MWHHYQQVYPSIDLQPIRIGNATASLDAPLLYPAPLIGGTVLPGPAGGVLPRTKREAFAISGKSSSIPHSISLITVSQVRMP